MTKHDYSQQDYSKRFPSKLPTQTDAWQKLSKLKPYDLTDAAITKARICDYKSSAVGIDVYYAFQRIAESGLNALQQLASEMEVIKQFKALLEGQHMNRLDGYASENRQVLHFAHRNIFEDLPDPFPCPNADYARKHCSEQLDRLDKFLNEVGSGALKGSTNKPFRSMLHVGIGGSSLGQRAIITALNYRKVFPVHFVTNVDPNCIAEQLRAIDPAETLVNVVSKSGGTLETKANEAALRDAFKSMGLNPAQHFIAVTEKGSPMDNEEHYLRIFHMKNYTGGRFSLTGMPGAVPISFAFGIKTFKAILRGAREMDLATLNPNLNLNPALLMALVGLWNRNFMDCESLAIVPYSQPLRNFYAYLQQIDMESNGKSISRQGEPLPYATSPIIFGETGTDAQHSFFQGIHQGKTIVPCDLIGFRQSSYGTDYSLEDTSSQQKLLANLFGQALALAKGSHSDNPNHTFLGNRPSSVILAERLDAQMLGKLISLYENKIALQGFLWNINSFDQPGVAYGKLVANSLLEHMQGKGNSDSDTNVEVALLKDAGLLSS